MTNLLVPLPLPSPPEQPRQGGTRGLLDELLLFTAALSRAYLAFCDGLQAAARKAEQDHLRGERLAAYRARHRWKAGDVRPLLSIEVNEIAQRRMAALKGRGRPVVRPHRPLGSVLHEKLTTWPCLFREDATPDERRRAFKTWPWWKHHVEALYRGELELARAKRIAGAHDHAERAVASALRMSQGKVHAICGEIRALRREDAKAADFPPMELAEYESWMKRNGLPKRMSA